MKHIFNILLIIATFGVILTSCDLDAPSKSAAEGSIVLSVEALAEGAVMGIHQFLWRDKLISWTFSTILWDK